MARMLVRQVLVMTGVLLSAVHAEPNAGTIHLKCSGMFLNDYGKQPINAAVKDETFTVDFDNDVVSGFWPRDYPITSTTLADLLTLLFRADPGSAVRTPPRA